MPAERYTRRGAAVRPGENGAIYYGLGVTEHSQGSTMVMGMANLAMATGNLGLYGPRRESAARPEQRAGFLRHGLVPARVFRLSAGSGRHRARIVREAVGRRTGSRTRFSHSEHVRCGHRGHLQGHVYPGRGPRPVGPEHQACRGGIRQPGMRRRAGPVPERDGQVRARLPAGHVIPREGRHVHQRRAAHQPRAAGDETAAGQGRMAHHPGTRPGDGLSDELRQ